MSTNYIPALRIPSKTVKPTATVIFIHGLGDSGHGWKFLSDLSHQSSEFDHISFIFPHAPKIPLTVSNGEIVSGWFDIYQFGGKGNKHDFDGYLKSIEQIKLLINEQISNGIKPERIIIGGFSQGAAITLGTLTTLDLKLGAFIPLSAPITQFLQLLKSKQLKFNIDTPVFHGQGDSDPIVSIDTGNQAADFFQNTLGYTNYKYKTYKGLGHSANNDEIEEIFKLFRKVLPKE
ncbi:hypothetical protein WICMUC_000748 [Wickerhamomyces mucosus]|uniref:Acyl-protein thioesterase 1 n=1 Tax=Wickerhamomyces mucosus TaxID=1378264 RepID=A0A9P8PX05_9ASCO|nr:hypothetical protein WICMUC_000748 [Wickerhamomyces mucosus]